MALPQRINVLAELERLGRAYEFAGDDEVKFVCPFHEDSDPSLSMNTETGQFKCYGCSERGDFLSFVSKLTGTSRSAAFRELSKRYDLGHEKSLDPGKIEEWHSRIWNAGPLLKELRARGVTNEMIRTYRLGENGGRVTIPIKSRSGSYVNCRRYLPGASGAVKMKNLKGRGKTPALYPVDQLRYDRIALCGGEIKAIVAAGQLNKHGIGAVSTTGGEHYWDSSLTPLVAGKTIYVVYDVDEEGKRAAEKVARAVIGAAKCVYIIALPLDLKKYPHGDINDFIASEGGDLFPLLESAEEWSPSDSSTKDYDSDEPIPIDMSRAYSAEMTEKRVAVEAVVAAMARKTYVVPKLINVACDRNQDCCTGCRVFLTREEKFKIHPEDPVILEIAESHSAVKRPALCRSTGVPVQCPSVSFSVEEYQQAEDICVSPKLEILNRGVERTLQKAICVQEGLELNENYLLTGRQYPHPKDQSATLLVGKFRPVGDALTNYSANGDDRLRKFRPREWTVEAVTRKLTDVYADLETNVTRIYQRKRMHLFMDMAWHSPLFIRFNGKVTKGWTEILVVGDSSQGKSEVATRLLEHYGVGEKVECKNTTAAGLVGGLQQIGGQWYVTWGVIPTHDKRLVILEEMKGLSVNAISQLTDMRSSGVAELTKIEKRRAMARTRLLALSNPRGERSVASYAFGVEIVRELIGSLEDVRRFDACLVISKDEVDSSVINAPPESRPAVPHEYDDKSCRELILWAWTRGEDQVVFEPGAEEEALRSAGKMCDMFTADIPIVDRGSMRFKLARLAAAVAARTFSSDDGQTLLVRRCHVEFVRDVLMKAYSSPTFGYIDYTRAIESLSMMTDEANVEKTVRTVMHASQFAESALRTSKFDHQDVMDWCGVDRQEASAIIGSLVRKRALIRRGRSYVKSPSFIDLLKKLVDEGLPDVPSHLKEDEF